jgi:predicted nucleic acid-binding protein
MNRGDRRHVASVTLLERAAATDCVQPLQTLGEFCTVVTRKYGVTIGEASAAVVGFRRLFSTVAAVEDDLDTALSLLFRHQMQFWDMMLLATARRAGSTVLFTEDMDDGATLGGVRIIDPYKPSNHDVIELALMPGSKA